MLAVPSMAEVGWALVGAAARNLVVATDVRFAHARSEWSIMSDLRLALKRPSIRRQLMDAGKSFIARALDGAPEILGAPEEDRPYIILEYITRAIPGLGERVREAEGDIDALLDLLQQLPDLLQNAPSEGARVLVEHLAEVSGTLDYQSLFYDASPSFLAKIQG